MGWPKNQNRIVLLDDNQKEIRNPPKHQLWKVIIRTIQGITIGGFVCGKESLLRALLLHSKKEEMSLARTKVSRLDGT